MLFEMLKDIKTLLCYGFWVTISYDEVLDTQNTPPSHVLYTNLRWMSIPDRISYHRAVHHIRGICI